jgi:hypothetical protein
MSNHFKSHTFRQDHAWETIDSFWTSPLSYWSRKSLRIEPPVPLRVMVLGRVVDESDAGWINYGGASAMFIQSVQALGSLGQRVRAEISDDPIREEEE